MLRPRFSKKIHQPWITAAVPRFVKLMVYYLAMSGHGSFYGAMNRYVEYLICMYMYIYMYMLYWYLYSYSHSFYIYPYLLCWYINNIIYLHLYIYIVFYMYICICSYYVCLYSSPTLILRYTIPLYHPQLHTYHHSMVKTSIMSMIYYCLV